MSTILQKEKAPSVMSGSALKTHRLSWWWSGAAWTKSIALISLASFVLLNLFLWKLYGSDKLVSKDLWSGAGSVDLVLDDFNKLPVRPTAVLMGSSLMMFPFWAIDKDRYPSGTSDIFHYHRSHVLEKGLAHSGFTDPVVFNMAVFGQMASDAYLYVDEYLKNNKRPDYLILGIAPRDFSDADVTSPMATMSFKRLVNLSNFPTYAGLYLPTWQSKSEFLAEHVCFFYGKRWHLQHEFDRGVQKAENAVLASAVLNIPGAGAANAYVSASTGSQKETRGFLFGGTCNERWHNSLDEYRRRYRNIESSGSNNLNVQFGFFKSILDVCRQRDIKVIVVNMPLTDANRSLFPAGWYPGFTNRLAQLCRHPGVRFLNLGCDPSFVRSDFWDTTHLAHPGGYKLVDMLLPVLADFNDAGSLVPQLSRVGNGSRKNGMYTSYRSLF